MNYKKVFDTISHEIGERGMILDEPNNGGIMEIMRVLQEKNLIYFDVDLLETESEIWLQASYYDSVIEKTIVIDNDFPDKFEDVEDFVNRIQWVESTIEKVKQHIK